MVEKQLLKQKVCFPKINARLSSKPSWNIYIRCHIIDHDPVFLKVANPNQVLHCVNLTTCFSGFF